MSAYPSKTSERQSLNCLAKSTPQRIRESHDPDTIRKIKDLLEEALSLKGLPSEKPGRGRKRSGKSPGTHSFELVLSFPSLEQPVPRIPSLGEELHDHFVGSFEKIASFLRQGPAVLERGAATSTQDVILNDIHHLCSPETSSWRGPFALLALRKMYDLPNTSSSTITEANASVTWQSVRHAVTAGGKLQYIIEHGGRGMIPLMAYHYRKWRDLPRADVPDFVARCKSDKKLATLIETFESQIDNYQATYQCSLPPCRLYTPPLSVRSLGDSHLFPHGSGSNGMSALALNETGVFSMTGDDRNVFNMMGFLDDDTNAFDMMAPRDSAHEAF